MGFTTPVFEAWEHIAALKPAFLSKKPHFSFITVHYFWIMGLTILGSILLYPARTGPPGGLDYIDALFFASGACTQSGLNTVDVNTLNTYQQIVLFLLPMLTNPITINTFVVFLRLYWFEKKFQNIAMESKKARRSIAKTISRSRSQAKDIANHDAAERGVNGRNITVMHETTRANGEHVQDVGLARIHEEKQKSVYDSQGVSSSSGNSDGSAASRSASVEERQAHVGLEGATTIKFADEVKRSDRMEEDFRLPQQRTEEEHLAILERQRNDSKGVLRIPGPRDQDRGMAPEQIDDEDEIRGLRRRASTFESKNDSEIGPVDSARTANLETEDVIGQARPRRIITIHEPEKPSKAEELAEDANAAKHVLSPLRLRKPRILQGDRGEDDENHLHNTKSRTLKSITKTFSTSREETMPYLSWEPTVGRNSAFVDLSEQQREELGGIEYRSLKSLALVLVCYFWGFTIFGIVSLTPWIWTEDTFGGVVTSAGQSKSWWGIFTTSSAFNDVGFTLTPDSMISFQYAIWPLLCMSFLVIIGNTGFPIMLRFVIWVTTKYVPSGSGIWEELRFLLDHPRRCFTLLFPAQATWWLFWILIGLNALDLLFFIILDLGNPTVTDLPVNIRILAGWFQAVATRTAGFAVVNLANLHPAIQVSYLVMMYISVLPIAISVRRTNVYEEKSLGIWGTPTEENEDESEPSYVGAHLRRQLSFDLWYIFLGLFIISISEGSRLQSNDPADQAFTIFAVLFEVVSAYGTVGLSLGYPTINASFSAEFGVIGKLIIIAMQIRGRHRGLPYELDRAILLPDERLQQKEAADAAVRLRRRSSAIISPGTNGLEQVGSGGIAGTKKSKATRGRSKERSNNLLSTLLHPGPTIPNSHRFHSDLEDGGRMLHHIMTGGLHTRAREDDDISPGRRPRRRSTAV